MPSDNAAAVSAFIEGAPPGELAEVIADIQKLTVNEPKLLGSVTPAFQKYNEDQLSTVKLSGSGQNVLISPYNALGDGKYYDVGTQKSFTFDHQIQKASDVQPYTHDSEYSDLIPSLLKSFSTHATEHYPSATYTVCPTPSNNTIALLLVSNKYSPANFWNGRYRSTYLFAPASSTLSGTIHVDVHYYEDGNVRLTTTKNVPEMKLEAGSAAEVVRRIAGVERAYQEELNRGFGRLSEGEFKGLRRQLPVTRQKVEWEKIGGYRLGQDIGGGRTR
ncbi:MAG: hypothetical protein L6R36_000723 [Xanthoria steineri]|nr:MAG: hypothetical protein L6R36_000723 [Xanthoria steineri]